MSAFAVTRRVLLGGGGLVIGQFAVGGAAAQGLFGGGNPPVDAAVRFRSIVVDVSPIVDHGGAALGERLASALLPELRKVFADRLAPGDRRGAVLTARMSNLFFTDYADRTADIGFGNNDNIEGDGIISDGGRVVSTTHVLTELPASYSGAPLMEGIDAARMRSISYQFAYWLRREMGL